jgi:hypothetical protein
MNPAQSLSPVYEALHNHPVIDYEAAPRVNRKLFKLLKK